VATLEERVAFLEGKMQEHSKATDGVRDAVVQLEARMNDRFEAIDRRFETLDDKMSRQFLWLLGAHLTTLVAIIAALASR
jgi:hypothetical protein